MFFLIHGALVFIYIFAIIYACKFFTNAIEHLGVRLKLDNSATGSILAVIGTSLPETVVPLVAIFGAFLCGTDINIGENVAMGAIIGSPFMLNTFALFVLGCTILFLYIFKKRKNKYLNLNHEIVLRDCKYFVFAYIPAILSAFLFDYKLKLFVVLYLFCLYCVFVFRTIIKSKENFSEQKLESLFILKLFLNFKNPNLFLIILQIILSLIGLIIFSHFFVIEIETFSAFLNVSPLILSLIITPFATELPECVNSIIWAKKEKDDLAVSNILGGTIFQATITMSVGILLTNWKFNFEIFLNTFLVCLCLLLFMMNVYLKKKITIFSLLLCGLFYFSFLIYVL